MEKISFFKIIEESWHTSFSRASFFVFGMFVALPFTLQILFPLYTTETTWEVFFQKYPLQIIGLLLILAFLKLFGKSNLITTLHAYTKDQRVSQKLSLKACWKNFVKGFFIDTILAAFFLALLCILFLPSLFSLIFLQNLPQALPFLGLLIFFPVVLISFFIREFSFFYLLLSPLSVRASLESGSALFIKHRGTCLGFGLFTLCLGLLFTFSLNLAMLGIVALFQRSPLPEEVLMVSTGLFFLSWYEIFSQALWLNFFKHLAAPKNTIPEEKSAVGFEEKISELPSA